MNQLSTRGSTLAGRYLQAIGVANGDPIAALGYVEQQQHRWTDYAQVKAAVDALSLGQTGTHLTAAPGDSFLELVRPRALLWRLPHLSVVPFETDAILQTAGASSYWVGEGGLKPMSAPAFQRLGKMPRRKVVGLAVVSNELLRSSRADAIVANDLAAACAAGIDAALFDGLAGDDDRPASVTHGALTVPATAAPLADALTALALFKGNLTTAAWIAHPETAARIGAKNPGAGQACDVGATGGRLLGIEVFTSEAVPKTAVSLVDLSRIEVAGGRDAELRTSANATLLMTDPDTGTAKPTSMFQTNCIGLLGEIIVNWRVGGPAGSAVSITGASY
ncbi:phage major capsid protein, HK97 family [Oryzisolibacter propanilivorax]|uniref:Phage major capsid protein, HK97 family n=1 Tax=Oryzisolibacter propanilivorax TaxID=1527607 RepID=A0A1G9RHM3_9BURK|nr:phage major capsid protein [Oryzisolibacter propanilivorax]SDM22746.1 phage major capsid protein, HK97 family [Oryzisolibacter propanilivorax]